MQRLYKTLTYESSTILLLAGYKFIGYGLLLAILSVTAVLYTPYLIKTLVDIKRWGWIVTFGIFVIIPTVLMFFYWNHLTGRTVFSSVTLLNFYFFCWILKFKVHGWIEDMEYNELSFDD